MDTFGTAVKQFHLHGNAQEIIERNDGYISANDISKYFIEYKDWSDVDKQLIEKVEGKTLDIGCGAGRHSIHLQSQGFEVLATDASPLCIEVTATRGVEKTQILRIEEIRKVKNPLYDSVLLLGANLGLLGSRQKAINILRSIDAITSPSARIYGSTNDYTKTTEKVHIAYRSQNVKCNRLPGMVKIRVRWQQFKGDWFNYLLFTKDDLVSALNGTAWVITDTIVASDGISHGYILSKKRSKTREV